MRTTNLFLLVILFSIGIFSQNHASNISESSDYDESTYSFDSATPFALEGDLAITSVTPSHEICPDANDGSLTVVATCTTCISSIEYSIDNVNWQPETIFDNLADGTYTVYARDSGDFACNVSDAGNVINAGVDSTPPTLVGCPATASFSLDLCNELTINAASLGITATDNCSTPTITLSKTDFTSAGTTTITVTATDDATLTSTCMVDVTMTTNPDYFEITALDDSFDACTETDYTFTASSLLSNDNSSNSGTLEVQEVNLTNPSDGTLIDNNDATYTFTPAVGVSGAVALTYIVKTDGEDLYNPDNGHFYEYISGNFSWTAARDLAEGMTLNGQQGYLATVTSQEENDFIVTKLEGLGWMGASDAAVEGEWRWVTGPEMGQQFWSGTTAASGGIPIGGMYNNWRINEPNNSAGGIEHYGHFLIDGEWNDYALTNGTIAGYLVEYGGIGSCVPNFTETANITITINGIPDIAAISTQENTCPSDDFDVASMTITDNNSVSGTVTTYHSAAPTSASDLTNQLSSTLIAADQTVFVMVAHATAGCYDVESFMVDITACCDISISSVTPTNETCPDANDGSLTVAATCSTCTTIEYSIENTNWQSGTIFDNLDDGTYTVYVRDSGEPTCSTNDAGNVINAGVDNTPPTLVGCPATASFTLDLCNELTINATSLGITATDNCSTPTITLSQTDFTSAGLTTITVTATDDATLTSTCMVDVTMTTNPDYFEITAMDDSFDACTETAYTFTASSLLTNDNASNSGTLEVQEVNLTNPSDGTLIDNNDGTYTFTPVVGVSGAVALTYIVKTDGEDLYNPDNGHFYEFISGNYSWTAARDLAEGMSLNGQQGYLATVTSQEENDFILTKLEGEGWMGASDAETDDVWKWVTGPEAGQQFWSGTTAAVNGVPFGGMYNNWRSDEPNNSAGGTEKYAHFLSDGEWNDYPLSNVSIVGYIVEYGGIGSCVPNFTETANITITVNGIPDIASISTQVNSCPSNDFDVASMTITDNNSVSGVATTYHSAAPSSASDLTNQLSSTLITADQTVFVMLANTSTGCYDVESFMVDITACCDIAITSVTPTDETCPGAIDGVITISATCASCANGNSDIRYSIDNIDFSNSTGVFSGLSDGTYTAYVHNVNDTGCNDSDGPYNIIAGEDNTAPTFTCPIDVTVGNDAGVCEATDVVLVSPTVSDNCNNSIVPTDDAPTTFQLGITTVTWTADDGNGQSATCMQTVTVADNELPTITCPADITINAETATCAATLGSYVSLVTYSDNCGLSGGYTMVEAGAFHTIAISSDGTLWSWGNNSYAQLGDGTYVSKNTPVQVGTANNWVGVAVGWSHSIGVRSDGTLWAWGRNLFGQLGDGTSIERTTPVQIGAATNWVSVGAGYESSFAIGSDGTLWSWGYNGTGQSGTGTTDHSNIPIQAGTATNWKSVDAGLHHSIATRSDGTLWSSGANYNGQLGDGTSTAQSSFVQVGSANDWESISAGYRFSVAIRSNGTLWSWGANSNAQLGDGTIINKNSPVQVGSATNWVSAAAGEIHGVAVRSDGGIWSWGFNDFGQLGDGTNNNNNSPAQIGASTNWASAGAGYKHSIGFLSDGSLMTWGKNDFGQLGDASVINRTSPVSVQGTSPSPLVQSPAAGTELAVGVHPVTFTVTDTGGNSASCTIDVTVLDNQAPTASCADITFNIVDLNTNNLSQTDIDAIGINSTDNCTALSFSITNGQTTYDCADIGNSYTVTLTATDGASLTSSCTANVFVSDPNSVCCDISITSLTPTAESCPNADDGTITVLAACSTCANGVNDIEYSSDGTNWQTSNVLTGLTDGSNTIMVRDANLTSCTDSDVSTIDAGVNTTYYADLDEDGFGDPNSTINACPNPPTGYVIDNTDCDDGDINEFPGQLWYIDEDGDNYGGSSVVSCERPTDGFLLSELVSGSTGDDDCDDTNPNVYLESPEVQNGIDDDCDGATDEIPTVTWIALANGTTTGACVSNTDCCTMTFCFGLEYNPGSTGVLTSYTTGFTTDCNNGANPISYNESCVMDDNSLELVDCNNGGILMNSSGVNGSLPINVNSPVILHQICVTVLNEETKTFMEDMATNISMAIDLSTGSQITEYPEFDDISVTGNQAPVLTAGTIGGCYASNIDAETAAIAATIGTDDCTGVVTYTAATVGTCSAIVTVTGYDACGLTSTVAYNTKIDGTNPIVNGSPDPSFIQGCSLADAPAAETTVAGLEALGGSIEIMDACTADIDLIVNSNDMVSASCPIIITRVYTIIDECGNQATFNHIIIINDSNAPTVSGSLDNIIVEACGGAGTAPIAVTTVLEIEALDGNLMIADVCTSDAALTVSHSDVVSGTCPVIINRTYTISDACSNEISVSQVIQINPLDNITENGGPVSNFVSMQSELYATAPSVFPEIVDGCGNIITPSAPVIGGTFVDGDCKGTITYTYTYEDCVGRTYDWVYTNDVDCGDLKIRVNLEGVYTGSGMTTTLHDYHLLPGMDKDESAITSIIVQAPYTPFGQPYQGAPWNFTGNLGDSFGEATSPGAPPGVVPYPDHVVDWVLVTVRENSREASANIFTCAAWVHTNGDVTFPETCPTSLSIDNANEYYLVVEHRNHLAVLQTALIMDTDDYLEVDFTANNSYAPVFRFGQKQVAPGVWAMNSANIEQKTSRISINSADQTGWKIVQGFVGYYLGDINMNGATNSEDETKWKINQNITSGIKF